MKSFDKIDKNRRIVLRHTSLFTKSEIQVLAFFAKNNNRPSTYIEIARAYKSASYSHFKKACEALRTKSWLVRLEDGSYEVHKRFLENLRKGTEFIELPIPYFDKFKEIVPRIRQKKFATTKGKLRYKKRPPISKISSSYL